MTWDLNLAIDPAASEPLFLQIARAIAAAIAAGRIGAGDRLPGTRTLATTLDVHRNTAVAAYGELASQGWIDSARGSGTFVSAHLPDTSLPAPVVAGVAVKPGYALGRAPRVSSSQPGDVLRLSAGVPDARLIPAAAIARAVRRASRRTGIFNYGDPRGEVRLRAAVAEMLARSRGINAGPSDVAITRGSQMAITIAARALIRSGDVVAVESLGYRPAWEALRAAGAVLRPIALDRDGLDVGRLAALCARESVRAVYLTPHHQYPTLATLPPGRRIELLALARRHRFAIIEDDYDNEYHYSGRPVLPLASSDAAGSVIYIGTLSKILAPAIRVGYAVAPRPVLDRMIAHREVIDGSGDRLLESAIAELFEDGEVERHVWRTRRIYQARRQHAAAALERHLGDAVRFDCPKGGMALWIQVNPSIDIEAWAGSALARGVHFETARGYAFDRRSRPAFRLGFAALSEGELERGVRTMAAALGDV